MKKHSLSDIVAASALDVPLTEPTMHQPAPPCAQPMDSLTKHFAWGFAIAVAMLLFVLNAPPPSSQPPAGPIACAAPQQR